MRPRAELHAILKTILGSDNVYFQPPEGYKMSYPCIVYKRDYLNSRFADNNPYHRRKRYAITIMDQNPDSEIPDKVAALPMCVFDRHFAVKQLNHDVYKIFF